VKYLWLKIRFSDQRFRSCVSCAFSRLKIEAFVFVSCAIFAVKSPDPRQETLKLLSSKITSRYCLLFPVVARRFTANISPRPATPSATPPPSKTRCITANGMRRQLIQSWERDLERNSLHKFSVHSVPSCVASIGAASPFVPFVTFCDDFGQIWNKSERSRSKIERPTVPQKLCRKLCWNVCRELCRNVSPSPFPAHSNFKSQSLAVSESPSLKVSNSPSALTAGLRLPDAYDINNHQ
jgi:hypothetical protein